jgi:hypothetical protein
MRPFDSDGNGRSDSMAEAWIESKASVLIAIGNRMERQPTKMACLFLAEYLMLLASATMPKE